MIDEPMNLDIGHMQYNRSLYMYDIVSKEMKTVWSTVDYSKTRSICDRRRPGVFVIIRD